MVLARQLDTTIERMGKLKAICVGINYPGTPAELYGCVNDANDWESLLSGAGYEVVKLLDGDATKANIMTALQVAASSTKRGHRLVFTYSGHGTWRPDKDGDEIDRRDEALCPIDFAEDRLIIDDELQEVFSMLPLGAGGLVISDSCHSGTLSRNLLGSLAPGRPRYIPPSSFTDLSTKQVSEMEEVIDTRSPRKSSSLISGCMDHEYSYDGVFDGRPNGAMSKAAFLTYRPGIRLVDWYKAIRSELPSADYPQTPQLSSSNLYRRYSRAI